MKGIIFLIPLFIIQNAFAQGVTPGEWGLKEFHIANEQLGDIYFYITEDGIDQEKPLLFIAQGSGGLPTMILVQCGEKTVKLGTVPPDLIKNFSDLVSLPAVGKPFSIGDDGTSRTSLFTPDDIGTFTRLLLHVDSSPHPAYNVGGPPTSMREVADAVRKYIPDAKIEFGNIPPPENRGKFGIPWRASGERAREDFGFTCMSIEEQVLIHINDARTEAGLELIS